MQSLRIMACAFAALCVGVTATGVRAEIIYVKASATGSDNGDDWTNAYVDFQDGIADASAGDQIWVSGTSGAGTVYVPTSGTTRTSTFQLVNGVRMVGGFRGQNGDEGIENITTRPIDAQTGLPTLISILSGEIGSSGSSDNCYHVITANGVDADTILDGFTITGGNANGSLPNNIGAGLYILGSASSPTVSNCVFDSNTAYLSAGSGAGGAIYSQMTTNNENELSFTNCVFTNNHASVTGGAVRISNADSAVFTSCRFQQNSTIGAPTSGNGFNGGGALYVAGGADRTLTLTDCRFDGNYTTIGEGGGLYAAGTDLRVRRCDFVENVANMGTNGIGRGGGIYVSSPNNVAIVDSRFIANESQSNFRSGGGLSVIGTNHSDCPTKVTVVNSQFLGNVTTGGGGGLAHEKIPLECVNTLFAGNLAAHGGAAHCEEQGCPEAEEVVLGIAFFNCTISDNNATENGGVGGIGIGNSFSATVQNCVLWNNKSNGVGGIAAQLQSVGSHTVTHTCIEGGFTGTGNINVDPEFVGPTTGDVTLRNYRLGPCSPASDAANDSNVRADAQDVDDDANTGEATPDLDLMERIADNPFRSDDNINYVDMGAYEINLETCSEPGDVNQDADVDALDIQCFLECVFGWTEYDACEDKDCGCADLNIDGLIDTQDRDCLVNLLLTGSACEITDCDIGQRSFPDCNENGTHDVSDIGSGASEDCNANGVPDECEIDEESAASGGPFFCIEGCATDVNDNGVPDECEADCNTNGTPDGWDISETTSNDVNTNGIPDECELDCNTNGTPDAWDLSEETSPDCNTNGIPDACENDCNTNGVPDDCDVDPTDPDGDEWVSPDCNGNEYPDECDLALPPGFGSLDCNDNDIPDECDIADCESDPACDDCNENGIPDACDITAEISEDADTNGIPDECEEESLMGGGGESMMGGAEFDEEAAWEAFFEWSMAQCWGPNCETTGAEQFQAMANKLTELGLPIHVTSPAQ